MILTCCCMFFFSSRRRHTRWPRDWSSDVCSSDLIIWIYFSIAGLFAIIATLPVVCLQLWLFIRPGLTQQERRASLSYIRSEERRVGKACRNVCSKQCERSIV